MPPRQSSLPAGIQEAELSKSQKAGGSATSAAKGSHRKPLPLAKRSHYQAVTMAGAQAFMKALSAAGIQVIALTADEWPRVTVKIADTDKATKIYSKRTWR